MGKIALGRRDVVILARNAENLWQSTTLLCVILNAAKTPNARLVPLVQRPLQSQRPYLDCFFLLIFSFATSCISIHEATFNV